MRVDKLYLLYYVKKKETLRKKKKTTKNHNAFWWKHSLTLQTYTKGGEREEAILGIQMFYLSRLS